MISNSDQLEDIIFPIIKKQCEEYYKSEDILKLIFPVTPISGELTNDLFICN